MHTPHPPQTAVDGWRRDLPLLLAVVAVAILGRLPAFGAWWALDDWGLLARAAGWEAAGNDLPARWLSQHLWWRVTWPLLGPNAEAHTVLRLLLHATSSVLVLRLGARAGLGRGGRLVAGLVFAASPLAFTSLYWAAGVQELLAVCFALAAMERWLAPGRGTDLQAGLWVLASVLAKEPGLGLPILMGAVVWDGTHRRPSPATWTLLVFLALAATLEGWLVVRHFATGPGDPYQFADPGVALTNIGVFGWWMISPGPILASRISWPMAAGGGTVFVLWVLWAAMAWRQGDRLPATLLLACVLALAPSLPLRHQIRPYLATLPFAALALALGRLVPRRWAPRPVILAAMAAVAVLWSFGGMRARLTNRDGMGLPSDPVVRSTSLSWQSTTQLRNLRWPPGEIAPHKLVLLQTPVAPESAKSAEALGERWIAHTELYLAMGGARGPRLATNDSVQVVWANALFAAPAEALVLCEFGEGFKLWGTTGNAALYAALTDVALGRFERARRHLNRAAELSDETVGFMWDEGQMILPLDAVLANKEAFVDWTVGLLAGGHTTLEVGGLQDMFLQLLSAATGRGVDDLTTGSRLMGAPDSDTVQP